MDSPADFRLRAVADIYDEPWIAWTLRTAGPHLHPGRELATAYLADRAAHHGMGAGGRVLEVASALGGPARMVARHFATTVVCVDMNVMMHRALRASALAEGLVYRLVPVLARTERLPFASGTFDAAWSQDALCHMDKAAVFAEVARVVRPGAVFAFSDWVVRGGLDEADWAELARTWGFPSLFSIATYVALADAAGFDVLHAEDRTAALAAGPRGGAPDEEAFARAFAARWGEAELARQREPGETWQRLVREGKTGFGMFIARRRGVAAAQG